MRLDRRVLDELLDDLANYGSDFESPEVRTALLPSTFARLLATLEIMPEELRRADILELGAVPFFLTLCLRRLCAGRLSLASYLGTPERHLVSRLTHARNGSEHVFDVDLFNIETDDFPYPPATFEAVIFAELIEHLALNPVRALAEIHRVLTPGGFLILTTPNRYSMLRLESFLRGIPQMVDRYAPLCGYGARHNREFGSDELCQLLEATGFTVEEIRVRDLDAPTGVRRLHRQMWRAVLRAYSDLPREEHVFIRARRRDVFHWNFPAWLFENMDLYVLAREPWLQMGINDAIQCADGWYGLEQQSPGVTVRWTRSSLARGFLRMPAGEPAFHLHCFAAEAERADPLRVRIVLWDRWLGLTNPECVYLDEVRAIERGVWHEFRSELRSRPPVGNEVEVRLEIDGGQLDSHRLEGLPEHHRGLAVARYALA